MMGRMASCVSILMSFIVGFAVFLFFSVYLFLPAMNQVFKGYAWLLVLLEFWFLLASIFEMHTH